MCGWLVVNADDFGVSNGATNAIIRAHKEGIVTSASMATTTPFYEHAVEERTRGCPNLGIGLHFTLTSGTPISSRADAPALWNATGFFRWRFTSLFSSVMGLRRKELLEQIDMELEAQLQKLYSDGIAPDHIDGERHVHLIPGIIELVIAAARRHRIKFVRAGTDIGAGAFAVGDAASVGLSGGFMKSWLLSGLSRRAHRYMGKGVSSPDHVASYFGSGLTHMLKRSSLQAPTGEEITEIMVHPGIPNESAGLALGNTELESYLVSDDRQRELSFCIDARKWIDESSLTNYSRLASGMAAQ